MKKAEKPAPKIIIETMEVTGRQRALRSLTNVFARPELPRGRFLGDRLYLRGQKAENLQVPLRKAGYDFVGDYKMNELGLQTELASGAVVVDGQLYCPVMKARQRLVNATADFQNGRIDEDEYYALLDERKKLQLAPLGKPVEGDGKQRFQCPARSKNAQVTCPLVARSKEKHPNRAKEPLLESEVPTSGMCGAVCEQASVTVQNTPENGAKYLNQGAPYGTKVWQEQYHRRNTIESRNDRVCKCSLLTSVAFQPRVIFRFNPLPRRHIDGGFLSLCQAFTYFTEGGTRRPVDRQKLKVLVTYFESETRGGVRVG